MALYSVNKSGFGNIRSLVSDIAFELTDTTRKAFGQKYFQCVYPSTAPGSQLVGYSSGDYVFTAPHQGRYPRGNVIIFESMLAVDPLANANVTVTSTGAINAAYRIAFVLHDDVTLTVHAGSRLTLPGIEDATGLIEGNLVFMTNRAGSPNALEFREPPGCVNVGTWSQYSTTEYRIFGTLPYDKIAGRTLAAGDLTFPGPNIQRADEVFISRINSQGATTSYPMNYQLTMTNRGIALVIWEDNQEEVPREAVPATGFNKVTDPVQVYGNSPVRWFVIQRAVDRNTGAVRGGYSLRGGKKWSLVDEQSRCPVFCVFGNSNPAYYQKFVVRENDQLTPSPKRPASVDTVDSAAILNPWPQQSVTEQGEFIVTFVSNLSTSRFRYGDEMDMIGTVGSEVVGHGTKIRVKVYNDTQTREYTAMYGNLPNGQGMKIMILTDASSTDENTNTGLTINSTTVPVLDDTQY